MPDRYWVAGGTGNYNSTTNWSASSGGASGASVPTTADNVFFNAASGAGTATINTGSNCANLNLTGFTGTLTFTNTLTIAGTVINFGTGGYTVTGASSLLLGSTNPTITSNGTVYTGNINFNGNTTYTLADNLSCTGTIILSNGTATTINGNTINVGGNLTHTGGAFVTGTTNFVFNGTGTWSHTSTGVLRNNFTINTAGTLTLGTNVNYQTGTLTYTAGTVVTTGSTLNMAAPTTLNTNGVTWNNISCSGAVTVTLSSNLTLTGTLSIANGTTSFTLGANSLISTNANLTLGSSGTLTMPANQTFKTLSNTGTNAGSINGNTLTITENLSLAAGGIGGTTNIIYAGTGTWTATISSAVLSNNFTINTAGTLTISGIVYKSTNTFTYTAGTVIDTGATVVISSSTTLNVSGKTWEKLLVNNAITLTSNLNTVTFGTTGANATTFVLGGNTLNFTHLELGNIGTTTLPSTWSCQNLTLVNASSGSINGFSITINGNIVQSASGNYSGTTTLTYAGTGTWSRTTGNGYFSNAFTINTAGTLTFSGGIIGGGIFTYTAGTVNVLPGSILYNSANNTTFNHGSIVWANVTMGTPSGVTSISNVVLNNQLICSETLTVAAFNITYTGTNGTFDVYNLILQNDTNNRTMTLASTKTYRVRQSFTCTVATSAARFLLLSTTPGSQAIFTIDQGATLDVGFVNATDIDSSLGKRIYSYRGVLSNATNWSVLPTDVKPATGVFVN
jgi:hypothetical protein